MLDRLLSPLFVALWTSGYVVGALALQVIGPAPLLEVRFACAALITLPFALRAGRWRRAPVGRLIRVGLFLQVLQFGGAYAALADGVPAGVSALVTLGLSPLVATAAAVHIGQERASVRRWIGLLVGAAGVFLGLVPELAGARIGLGLIFAFVSMIGLAGGSVLQKRDTAEVDPRVSIAVQSTTAAVVVAPALALIGGPVHPGAQLGLSVAWLGIGMAVISLGVLLRLLSATSASHVGALLLLVPATTTLASVPVLGQPIHPLTLAGMAVSAVGVGAALTTGPPSIRSWRARRRPTRSAAPLRSGA